MASPCTPSAAMKANARGTPPRLAATPLNDVANVRNHRGRRTSTTAKASRTPTIPPMTAVSTESLMLSMNDSRNGWSRAWSMAGLVLVDECDRALTNTVTAGNTRNAPTKAMNGSSPRAAGIRSRRRPAAAPAVATAVIRTVRLRAGDHRAPVVVITWLALANWSAVGNSILASTSASGRFLATSAVTMPASSSSA